MHVAKSDKSRISVSCSEEFLKRHGILTLDIVAFVVVSSPDADFVQYPLSAGSLKQRATRQDDVVLQERRRILQYNDIDDGTVNAQRLRDERHQFDSHSETRILGHRILEEEREIDVALAVFCSPRSRAKKVRDVDGVFLGNSPHDPSER